MNRMTGGLERTPAARFVAALVFCFVASSTVFAVQRYPAFGVVLKIQAPRTLLVSCAEIPHFMDAMEMTFAVAERGDLADLRAGMLIDFTIVAGAGAPMAEHIRAHHYIDPGAEPLAVQRLELLGKVLAPQNGQESLAIGQSVPDFALTDQHAKPVRLSDFSGKTVAITFLYTRCPFANYCFRLANNFGRVERRFANRMDKDLVLLSVTFDPQTDSPEVLEKYASTWKENTRGWYFLTGPLPEIRRVCHMFGMNVWSDEGMLAHSLHTAVIGQDGKLVANLNGNEFTAQQLGDLIQTIMDSRAGK